MAGLTAAHLIALSRGISIFFTAHLTDGEVGANISVDSDLEAYINEMIEKRAAAKKERDFATADGIRDELAAKGIILKDTREGTTYEIQ